VRDQRRATGRQWAEDGKDEEEMRQRMKQRMRLIIEEEHTWAEDTKDEEEIRQ
jgi:hypothetical protein